MCLKAALDHAAHEKLRVLLTCSYLQYYVDKNPEYKHLVEPAATQSEWGQPISLLEVSCVKIFRSYIQWIILLERSILSNDMFSKYINEQNFNVIHRSHLVCSVPGSSIILLVKFISNFAIFSQHTSNSSTVPAFLFLFFAQHCQWMSLFVSTNLQHHCWLWY